MMSTSPISRALRPRRGSWLLVAALATLATACFPHQPGPRLAHFAHQAPQVGDTAPGFEVRDLEGRTVRLQDLVGERPLVLQLGSHTCPVFRYRRHWMRGLVEDYGESVKFVVVYTREAHPVGGPSPYSENEWNPWINRLVGVRLPPADQAEQRLDRARWSSQQLELEQPVLVDDSEDQVWESYGSAPSAAFIIDRQGRVAARMVWVDPKQIRATLDRILAADDAAGSP